MAVELLITTNGFEGTWQAVEYGAWFAESMRMDATLLGVNENLKSAAMNDNHRLNGLLERAVSLFKEKKVGYNLELLTGAAEKVIPKKANSGDYITIVSPLGRPPLKRWLSGRSIRPLMEAIRNPILYVPKVRIPLEKMLVSIGGLNYAVTAENLAFQVAVSNQADVTILHVIPPTDLDYPSTRDVRAHVNNLADTDTLSGRSLRRGLELAQSKGVNAKAIVRQGNIVEEIFSEVREGNYDLVCMGSSYSASALRQLYTPNVTAEIAEASKIPVLTARFQPESG